MEILAFFVCLVWWGNRVVIAKYSEAILNLLKFCFMFAWYICQECLSSLMSYCTYILANYLNTVLYVGMTNNLPRRVWEHKNHRNPKSFTAQYNVSKLVYYSYSERPGEAIAFEKQLKAGSRAKKEKLINEMNPLWKDLSGEIGIEQVWVE